MFKVMGINDVVVVPVADAQQVGGDTVARAGSCEEQGFRWSGEEVYVGAVGKKTKM